MDSGSHTRDTRPRSPLDPAPELGLARNPRQPHLAATGTIEDPDPVAQEDRDVEDEDLVASARTCLRRDLR
ncbi:hypothetical protein [Gordonia amicalis]|uniref:hypothetical protein n=1 Tax=Gordonia amicalis TaxID=89053 RepID=UPI001576965D|nr:hypothetical protein [Gordonia amicalis]MBA5849452.1 hypothetical protein [Gordonia amicalis]MCZ4579163.1 hypothetical protein [Gordonia amicalis]MDV7171911.1 hypothetical protein [Gordonia amicalis]UOG22546.1 hypothetical protein MTX80_06005 [Gordonia amicalis]